MKPVWNRFYQADIMRSDIKGRHLTKAHLVLSLTLKAGGGTPEGCWQNGHIVLDASNNGILRGEKKLRSELASVVGNEYLLPAMNCDSKQTVAIGILIFT